MTTSDVFFNVDRTTLGSNIWYSRNGYRLAGYKSKVNIGAMTTFKPHELVEEQMFVVSEGTTMKLFLLPTSTSAPVVIKTFRCSNLRNDINAVAVFFDDATLEWFLVGVAGRLVIDVPILNTGSIGSSTVVKSNITPQLVIFAMSNHIRPLEITQYIHLHTAQVNCMAAFPTNSPGSANRLAVGFEDGSVGILVVTVDSTKKTAKLELKPHIVPSDSKPQPPYSVGQSDHTDNNEDPRLDLKTAAERSTAPITNIDVFFESAVDAVADGNSFVPSTPANLFLDDTPAAGKVLRVVASSNDGRVRVYDPDSSRLLRLTKERANKVATAISIKNRFNVARALRWSNVAEKTIYEWETQQQGLFYSLYNITSACHGLAHSKVEPNPIMLAVLDQMVSAPSVRADVPSNETKQIVNVWRGNDAPFEILIDKVQKKDLERCMVVATAPTVEDTYLNPLLSGNSQTAPNEIKGNSTEVTIPRPTRTEVLPPRMAISSSYRHQSVVAFALGKEVFFWNSAIPTFGAHTQELIYNMELVYELISKPSGALKDSEVTSADTSWHQALLHNVKQMVDLERNLRLKDYMTPQTWETCRVMELMVNYCSPVLGESRSTAMYTSWHMPPHPGRVAHSSALVSNPGYGRPLAPAHPELACSPEYVLLQSQLRDSHFSKEIIPAIDAIPSYEVPSSTLIGLGYWAIASLSKDALVAAQVLRQLQKSNLPAITRLAALLQQMMLESKSQQKRIKKNKKKRANRQKKINSSPPSPTAPAAVPEEEAEEEGESDEEVNQPPVLVLQTDAGIVHESFSDDEDDSSSSKTSSFVSGQASTPVCEPVTGVIRIGTISYSPKEQLGEGSLATKVYSGLYHSPAQTNNSAGRPCAVKVLNKAEWGQMKLTNGAKWQDLMRREFANLELLWQDYPVPPSTIIRYYSMEEDEGFVYISLEKCESNLRDFMRSSTWRRDPATWRMKAMREITSAVAFLHSRRFVHNDITPYNVLYSKASKYAPLVLVLSTLEPRLTQTLYSSFKLSDFGVSKQLVENQFTLTLASHISGASGFHPREILISSTNPEVRKKKTAGVDIFSLGCLFYFILSDGKSAWSGDKPASEIIVGNKPDLVAIKDNQIQMHLIQKMLEHAVEKRPRASYVLHHPMFWSAAYTLDYLHSLSNAIHSPTGITNKVNIERVLATNLEGDGDWKFVMGANFWHHITKRSTYQYTQCVDLVRAIRNVTEHWNEAELREADLGEIVGVPPRKATFAAYIAQKFPQLLVNAYELECMIKKAGKL